MKLRFGILLGIVALLVASCDGGEEAPKLDENEAEQIRTILKTGVEHPDDPFVRAETFRVLELLADERLGDMAKTGTSDKDPMVRVASLRATLASKHPQGRGTALDMFRKEKGAVQEAVLDAALEHGPPPLKREIVGRALRTGEPAMRKMAFERGLLARIDRARKAKNKENLERHLLPELGTYVSMDDPGLAALALSKFEELGEADRAEPIVEKFSSGRTPADVRVRAGLILARAHSKAAKPAFKSVMDRWERSMNSDELGLPQAVVPQDLLRAATLGMIATGDTKYVERAQKYTKNVSTAEMLEVLEALSTNPSEDAAVSLKIAMQDARSDVRSFAIDAYKDRDDASPQALYDILPAAPYNTQRQVAQILWTKFPDAWVDANKEALQRSSEVDGALRLLRNVVTTPEEIKHIVGLKSTLEKISKDEKEERSMLASYLLKLIERSSGAESAGDLGDLDRETTYAYLELLVASGADESALYRKYFYADNFALRLMSAAGLWKVTGGSEPAAGDGPDAAE